ncbi:MAG: caspase family protein [Candidatus Sericytochromatia bacterium]
MKQLSAFSLLLVVCLSAGGLSLLPGQVSAPWIQAAAQQQVRKVALVIGNKDYASSPLSNTLNDARDMAAKLKGLGFEVILKENLEDVKALQKALLEAAGQIQPGGVFLFYYSGHGMQINEVNYLIPTSAEIQNKADVEVEALELSWVLDKIEAAQAQVNIVILDACRHNPFGRGFRGEKKGLAGITSPSGTYIVFAANTNQEASDNPNGRNGLFTQELLRNMDEPGLVLEQVFKRTARSVRSQSYGKQEPWIGSSSVDDFYFVSPENAPGVAPIPLATTLPTLRPTVPPRPEPTAVPDEPQRVLRNSLGMTFNLIPAGNFSRYGSLVTLSQPFYMQTTEVTQGQWQAVMGNNPSVFHGDPNLPVENMDWEDVQAFIHKLRNRNDGWYRLPTEAEWEYAARAGSSTTTPCGDTQRCFWETSWYDENSEKKTHTVAQKKPNTWGLYDMFGNVSEWVSDWDGDYPNGPVSDPQGPSSGTYKMHRGGSWYLNSESLCSACRSMALPRYRFHILGFRLVREL